ncbi:MAG: hypothetical protein HY402_03880 [Elusimicrobia bacterium]|nr:hypothetical protein [Elusimicrobiota bacterium]
MNRGSIWFKGISVVLSGALVLTAPGLGSYEALARAVAAKQAPANLVVGGVSPVVSFYGGRLALPRVIALDGMFLSPASISNGKLQYISLEPAQVEKMGIGPSVWTAEKLAVAEKQAAEIWAEVQRDPVAAELGDLERETPGFREMMNLVAAQQEGQGRGKDLGESLHASAVLFDRNLRANQSPAIPAIVAAGQDSEGVRGGVSQGRKPKTPGRPGNPGGPSVPRPGPLGNVYVTLEVRIARVTAHIKDLIQAKLRQFEPKFQLGWNGDYEVLDRNWGPFPQARQSFIVRVTIPRFQLIDFGTALGDPGRNVQFFKGRPTEPIEVVKQRNQDRLFKIAGVHAIGIETVDALVWAQGIFGFSKAIRVEFDSERTLRRALFPRHASSTQFLPYQLEGYPVVAGVSKPAVLQGPGSPGAASVPRAGAISPILLKEAADKIVALDVRIEKVAFLYRGPKGRLSGPTVLEVYLKSSASDPFETAEVKGIVQEAIAQKSDLNWLNSINVGVYGLEEIRSQMIQFWADSIGSRTEKSKILARLEEFKDTPDTPQPALSFLEKLQFAVEAIPDGEKFQERRKELTERLWPVIRFAKTLEQLESEFSKRVEEFIATLPPAPHFGDSSGSGPRDGQKGMTKIKSLLLFGTALAALAVVLPLSAADGVVAPVWLSGINIWSAVAGVSAAAIVGTLYFGNQEQSYSSGGWRDHEAYGSSGGDPFQFFQDFLVVVFGVLFVGLGGASLLTYGLAMQGTLAPYFIAIPLVFGAVGLWRGISLSAKRFPQEYPRKSYQAIGLFGGAAAGLALAAIFWIFASGTPASASIGSLGVSLPFLAGLAFVAGKGSSPEDVDPSRLPIEFAAGISAEDGNLFLAVIALEKNKGKISEFIQSLGLPAEELKTAKLVVVGSWSEYEANPPSFGFDVELRSGKDAGTISAHLVVRVDDQTKEIALDIPEVVTVETDEEIRKRILEELRKEGSVETAKVVEANYGLKDPQFLPPAEPPSLTFVLSPRIIVSFTLNGESPTGLGFKTFFISDAATSRREFISAGAVFANYDPKTQELSLIAVPNESAAYVGNKLSGEELEQLPAFLTNVRLALDDNGKLAYRKDKFSGIQDSPRNVWGIVNDPEGRFARWLLGATTERDLDHLAELGTGGILGEHNAFLTDLSYPRDRMPTNEDVGNYPPVFDGVGVLEELTGKGRRVFPGLAGYVQNFKKRLPPPNTEPAISPRDGQKGMTKIKSLILFGTALTALAVAVPLSAANIGNFTLLATASGPGLFFVTWGFITLAGGLLGYFVFPNKSSGRSDWVGFLVGAILGAVVGLLIAGIVSAGVDRASAAAAGGAVSLAATAIFGWPSTEALRTANSEEHRKIEVAIERAKSGSPWARSVLEEFEKQVEWFWNHIWIADDLSLAYHARAFGSAYRNPNIVLTADTIRNGSWAFIASKLVREATYFTKYFGWDDPRTSKREDIPASVEKLAIAYVYDVLGFAQMTQGNSRSWATNLDHNHKNKGTWYEWSYYEALRQVLWLPFIDTRFFTHLRDFTALEVNRDPAFQFSLYERWTGKYWRPGSPEHEQPIPDNVPRLDEATYREATKKIYGQDGNGDNNSTENFLGLVRDWFLRNDPQ